MKTRERIKSKNEIAEKTYHMRDVLQTASLYFIFLKAGETNFPWVQKYCFLGENPKQKWNFILCPFEKEMIFERLISLAFNKSDRRFTCLRIDAEEVWIHLEEDQKIDNERRRKKIPRARS